MDDVHERNAHGRNIKEGCGWTSQAKKPYSFLNHDSALGRPHLGWQGQWPSKKSIKSTKKETADPKAVKDGTKKPRT
jgi:hypothetical protein